VCACVCACKCVFVYIRQSYCARVCLCMRVQLFCLVMPVFMRVYVCVYVIGVFVYLRVGMHLCCDLVVRLYSCACDLWLLAVCLSLCASVLISIWCMCMYFVRTCVCAWYLESVFLSSCLRVNALCVFVFALVCMLVWTSLCLCVCESRHAFMCVCVRARV
jgi:hypothetical protein